MVKITCSNCDHKYTIPLNIPATIKCQKCGCQDIQIAGDGSYKAFCSKCKKNFVLGAGKKTLAIHEECKGTVLTLNILSEKPEIAVTEQQFNFLLTPEEIKNTIQKCNTFKINDKIKIALIKGQEAGHIKWPYLQSLAKALGYNKKYDVHILDDHLISRSYYSFLNACDLVIGQLCKSTLFALKLRVPTIIIHTPIKIDFRADVGMAGILEYSCEDEIVLKTDKILKKPNLSYCVVTHNKLENTKKCIKKIREYKRVLEEIVVVDNNSTDDTVVWLKEQKDLVVIYNKENLGCAIARNQAMKKARGRYLLLLDNDQFLNIDSLHLLRMVDADIVGVEGWQMSGPGSPMNIKTGNADYVGGGGMLLRRDIAESLGWFDEAFSPAWFEDSDFCYRAKKQGYTLGFCDAKIEHKSHSTNSNQNQFDSQEVWNRNRKLFLKRHGGNQGLNRSTSKPKILMLIDVVGWAWDYKSRQIKNLLADDFDIELAYTQTQVTTALKDIGYDLYFCFDCPFMNYFINIPKNRKITGVTAHTFVNFHNYARLLGEAGTIHANSMMLYHEIEKYNEHVFYIPNGVDENHFKYVERNIKKPFTIGYVGKEITRKGYKEYIIPACEQAGVKLKAQTTKYNDYNKIDRSDMPKFYEDVDCIIIASDMDGTPNQLLEAASTGRTFIANPIGNVPEFYEGELSKGNPLEGRHLNGIIIPERKIDLYVPWINALKENREECKKMGIKARETIEKGWTWKAQSENYRKMFKKCLG